MLRAVHNVGVGAAKKFVFGVEIYLFVADIEERQYLVAVLDAGYDVCLPVVGGHYLGERAAKCAVPESWVLFFERVELSLNDNSEEDLSSMTTNERIDRMKGDELDNKECRRLINDNKLFELYFNFGRYLLISSSRTGTRAQRR